MSRTLAAVGSVAGIVGGAALGRLAIKAFGNGRYPQDQGSYIGAFVGAAIGAAIGAGTEIRQVSTGVSGLSDRQQSRFP